MAKGQKPAKASRKPAKPANKVAPKRAASPKPKAVAKSKLASRSAKPVAKRSVASASKKATASKKSAAKLPVSKNGAAIGSKIAATSSPVRASAKGRSGAAQLQTKKVMPTNTKDLSNEVKPGGGIVQPATRNAPAMRLRADDAEILATAKNRYGRKDLDMFRKLIQDQQQETREEFDILSQNILDTSGEFDADNQAFSLHTAEQGSDAIEREKTFLHAQRTSDYLKKLEEALERIDRGTYGICVVCGELIEKERLQAVPITQKHVDCKNRTQVRKVGNGSGFHDVEEQPVNLD